MIDAKNYLHVLSRNKLVWAVSGLLLMAVPATGLALFQASDNSSSTPSSASNATDHNMSSAGSNPNISGSNSTGGLVNDNGSAQSAPHSSAQLNVESKSSASSNAKTEVTVNGESVQVPANGSVHKNMTSDDGSVSLDVSVRNGGSGSTTVNSSSSSSVQINTYSSTSSSNGETNDNGEVARRHR